MYTTNMSYNMLIVLHAFDKNIAISQYGRFVEFILLYYLKDGHSNRRMDILFSNGSRVGMEHIWVSLTVGFVMKIVRSRVS